MAGRRHKKVHHEEHPDERWLVTFADLMVLLVAVFIVLFAISSVNTSKAADVKKSIADAMSGKIIPGGDAIKETGGQSNTAALKTNPPNPSLRSALEATRSDGAKAAKAEEEDLQRLQAQVQAYAQTHGLDGKVVATVDKDGLNIRLKTDGLLFDSGSALLKPASAPFLDKLGGLLRTDPDHAIHVEGHTDSVPAGRGLYPSNWELSTARSSAVVRALVRRHVAPARLTATGRADLDPIATNATDAGRSENRRVEIVLPRRQVSTDTESTP
jgi:chemotaxis protein MotB